MGVRPPILLAGWWARNKSLKFHEQDIEVARTIVGQFCPLLRLIPQYLRSMYTSQSIGSIHIRNIMDEAESKSEFKLQRVLDMGFIVCATKILRSIVQSAEHVKAFKAKFKDRDFHQGK